MVETVATGAFTEWFDGLDAKPAMAVAKKIDLLRQWGVSLPFPHSSKVMGSKHPGMRELRVKASGDQIRVFYAFDPARQAVLLIGEAKVGNDRFYEEMVRKADGLFDEYLSGL